MSLKYLIGSCITQRNDSVTIGKDFHSSSATNLVFLWNDEVLPAPVRTWKEGSDVVI